MHVWLSLEELGTLRLRTLNGLVITVYEVDTSVDMGEYGRLVVERGATTALSSRLGERIESVSRLFQQPPGATVGMLLHFRHHSVGIADLGDDLVVAEGQRLGQVGESPSNEAADFSFARSSAAPRGQRAVSCVR